MLVANNAGHNSIKFTIEFEQAKEIPFLDILVERCPNNTFTTSVQYLKKTFTGLYTQMGFIYTSQVQNQPHPHAHVSMLSYLLHRFIVKIRCRGFCYKMATLRASSLLRWLEIVSSTYTLIGRYNHYLSLDATIMVSKNCPTIGEHVIISMIK